MVQLALRYKFRINLMKFLFLVNFYILVPNSAKQQGSLRLNFNNLIYTYQNLMGLKRTKTRQTTLQHVKISDFNKLNRNYGIIYKIGQIWGNWNKLAALRIRSLMNNKETKGWIIYEILIPKWWDIDILRLLSFDF